MVLMLGGAGLLLAGAPVGADLYLVELGTNPKGEQIQTVVRFRFNASSAAFERTALFTTATIGGVRFDLGRNALIGQGRYLANNWGDVIDLNAGRAVREGKEQEELVRSERSGKGGLQGVRIQWPAHLSRVRSSVRLSGAGGGV
jgi:hypothetical protein